jgi:type II secretory pathway component PulJ
MTLVEIMIAIGILAVMLSLAWSTTNDTINLKTDMETAADRAHEVRVGLARVVADLEHAYLSKNEEVSAMERRTLFVGKDTGQVDDLRFSSLVHQPLFTDANEADNTIISYTSAADREDSRLTNWIRREQRRLTDPGETAKSMAGESDVVLRDIVEVNFEYWNFKDEEWESDWDTTKADYQKDRLPTRVRITLVYNDVGAKRTIVTEARVYLQEPIESRFGTEYDR